MASRPGLLKDGSWIKKADDEEEDIDRDPNFGKTILGKRNSGESNSSLQTEEIKNTRNITTSSVQALSKRFGGSSDDLVGSPTSYKPNSSTTTTTVTKDGKTTETTITTSGGLRSPVIKSPTKTDTFTERVLKASGKGPQFSPLSPTKTTKVLETTVTTSKDAEDGLYDTLIPKAITDSFSPINSKTTVSTTETVLVKGSPGTDSEDKLFDTVIPSTVKNTYSPMDSKTSVSSTETVTVRSSNNGDVKTTTTTRSSSSAEDDLYGTLLPKAITSGLNSTISSSSSSITRREYITVESSKGLETQISSSPTSTRRTTSSYNDDIPSSRTTSYTINTKSSDIYDTDNKSYSYSKPDSSYEYNSIRSPSSYSSTTYRSSSRSDDGLSDPIYSKSSTKNVYGSSDRAVLEKDLCTYCHKPFTGDAKMVLDEMKINCHVTCFKCEVCNRTLEHLKAGDSMWVYKHMVHCENCFGSTRDRWRL